MAAAALSGWQHLQQPYHHGRMGAAAAAAEAAHKPTRFAHLNRLPAAAVGMADQQSGGRPPFPAPGSRSEQWPQQAPLQGRMRPFRRAFHDAESRSGSEQGLTPDASPRDPSPKPAPSRPAAARLPAPNGNLLNLSPDALGLGGSAFALASAGMRTPSQSSLYHRRLSEQRAAAAAPPKPYSGRTGHSKWGRRRH
eukprot:TRINITY_DN17413_c0_g2_i1.p2 TRINITY_DN17413_c0_g2~~TRINITY_DN17413_c0_g2_i1.p2  ORF type:complete len:195 (+),score=45.75 TRINITY_DN17413_c0_g2_i1:107-691(+)